MATITIRIIDPTPGTPLAEMSAEHPHMILDVSSADLRGLMRKPRAKTKRGPRPAPSTRWPEAAPEGT